MYQALHSYDKEISALKQEERDLVRKYGSLRRAKRVLERRKRWMS